MIAIGIVTYNDIIDHTNQSIDVYNVVLHLITTINLFTTEEYVLIIVDNGSLDYRFSHLYTILKTQYKHLNIVFIKNEVNSLTNAWNKIITLGIHTFNCDGIILLNQDIILTKYWTPLVKAVQVQRQDIIAPMTTGACYQILQEVSEEKFKPEDKVLVTNVVQGCCFGASTYCFNNNMYDKTNYFNPNFPFSYNEEEWQQRNNKLGGKSLILKNSFVIHLDQASWLHAGLLQKGDLTYTYTGKDRDLILDKFPYSAYYNCR